MAARDIEMPVKAGMWRNAIACTSASRAAIGSYCLTRHGAAFRRVGWSTPPPTVDGELDAGDGTAAPRPRCLQFRCGFPCLCPVRPAAAPPSRWVGPPAASSGGAVWRR